MMTLEWNWNHLRVLKALTISMPVLLMWVCSCILRELVQCIYFSSTLGLQQSAVHCCTRTSGKHSWRLLEDDLGVQTDHNSDVDQVLRGWEGVGRGTRFLIFTTILLPFTGKMWVLLALGGWPEPRVWSNSPCDTPVRCSVYRLWHAYLHCHWGRPKVFCKYMYPVHLTLSH